MEESNKFRKKPYQGNNQNQTHYENAEPVFSKKLRAGRRRTYFFDVRATKENDYFLTITESKKRPNEERYDRHKIFLYKEDFNKFLAAMNETVNHVKTELLPGYNFDEFDHQQHEGDQDHSVKPDQEPSPEQDSEASAMKDTETPSASQETPEQQETPGQEETPDEEPKNDPAPPASTDEDLKW